MDLKENKYTFWVGLFIFVGLIIFIVAIFTLGSQQKSFVKGLHLKARFENVSGLIKGNNVWFSGVKVGTIKNIVFSGTNQVDVEFNVDQAVQQYIHKDGVASIGSEGFIGNKIITIDGGSATAPVIQDGDMMNSKGMLSTDEIMATLQKNNQNLLEITTNFKSLSKDLVDGKGLAGSLMSDERLASRFKGIVENLETTTQRTSVMAEELGRFGRKMNTKGGLADKMLTDTAVFANLQRSADNFKAMTQKANVLVDNLNNASNKLNTTNSPIGVLLNDQKKAEELKSTLGYLHESSIKLNDDLEAVQHNFLLRGFFKNREKEKKKAQGGN
ncbi:MlaD family protein [Mucilaginibacter daejeonensis]|uniref:MlaD family protein n=1 Tax=Mucilaginibacter daejeonensis TaxID=398049 RepID=UPI001D1712BB|nr:MlaD family protein [Mucilaginibacter daejeonensis]UEG51987.1 MlaD family protein [Mucilaginibacter daejeonensis]